MDETIATAPPPDQKIATKEDVNRDLEKILFEILNGQGADDAAFGDPRKRVVVWVINKGHALMNLFGEKEPLGGSPNGQEPIQSVDNVTVDMPAMWNRDP